MIRGATALPYPPVIWSSSVGAKSSLPNMTPQPDPSFFGLRQTGSAA
jgi:hypothetical protein